MCSPRVLGPGLAHGERSDAGSDGKDPNVLGAGPAVPRPVSRSLTFAGCEIPSLQSPTASMPPRPWPPPRAGWQAYPRTT